MTQRESQEAVAATRMEIIAPLVAKGIDSGQAKHLRDKICEQTGLSERTIRRYVKAYNEAGFEGLKPKSKGRSGTSIIPDDILEEAIYLRREVPSRSISQIIKLLEMEKRIQPGDIKRSTLQEQLSRRGYSSRHIRLYNDPGIASRRYQHAHRNQLWHSDIKYGPYLPIGPNGKKRTSLSCGFSG
ncbi:helix-turn-helix domain-containing protein [Salipaludibacillus sp. CUR1]|uniref:helix-turn-helix domain-containing protein n=1 Tax=Salipaludibacillus sp. CUR1 TaxID=2820003 RepID=UPI001E59EED9|nr:helix-turn-helix domain-containing protein [Salipaludibacillus sp. CUR1]MCE7791512.1 helix-turn-helix domain-containing protein [Salipaludibacillus sp. CUR1]